MIDLKTIQEITSQILRKLPMKPLTSLADGNQRFPLPSLESTKTGFRQRAKRVVERSQLKIIKYGKVNLIVKIWRNLRHRFENRRTIYLLGFDSMLRDTYAMDQEIVKSFDLEMIK